MLTELSTLTSPLTTAMYEQILEDICAGKSSPDTLFKGLYTVLAKVEVVKNFNLLKIAHDYPCPRCGNGFLKKKTTDAGIFWGCSEYKNGCKGFYKDTNGKPLLIDNSIRTTVNGPIPNNIVQKTSIVCPVCNIGYMVERSGKFGNYFNCSNYPRCKTNCKAMDGKPDLNSLANKLTPALLTLNESEVHQVLHKIALHAYPTYKTPEFTIKFHIKELKSYHGNWSYPKSNKVSHINIYNLSRKYEHTLSTTIHELAHHCHYMISGLTNHKKEFYEVLKHLLEVAHNLGFINLIQTYDMIDNADRRQLEKYFGLPQINQNNKVDFDLIKIESSRENPAFKARGYIYSTKECKWICSLYQKDPLKEIAWLESGYPNIVYEVVNNKTNVVEPIYFCIIGNFHAVHPDTLKAHGFYLDQANGWVRKLKAREKPESDNFCHKLNLKPRYKGFVPKLNTMANAYQFVPVLGKSNNKTCPACGSQLITNKGKFGKFISCSKFLMGCKFTESRSNVRK